MPLKISNRQLFDEAGNSDPKLPFRDIRNEEWDDATMKWDFDRMRSHLRPGEVIVALYWPYPWPKEILGEYKGLQVSAIPDAEAFKELQSLSKGRSLLFQCFTALPINKAEEIGAL